MKYEVFLITPWTDDVLFDDFVQNHKIDDWAIREVKSNYRSIIFILIDGKIDQWHFDMGEPEDNTFSRDWSWIQPALLKAYELGRSHEKK